MPRVAAGVAFRKIRPTTAIGIAPMISDITIRSVSAMRRFTRPTNGFSKKLQNREYMFALYALWYNFVRIHKTLRVSPAMAARIESRL